MKSKKKLAFLIIGILIIAAIGAYFALKPASSNNIVIKPKRGVFYQTVTSSGELQAINSIEIKGPQSGRQVGIWQMKISRLIPEGTIVKEGDFVAELDKTEVMTKIKELELNIQKIESQFTQAKLDSSLNLSSLRDEMENLRFGLEEKGIIRDQSAFEAPAIQRQAQIDYERSERAYKQSVKSYSTKVQQAIAKLSEVGADLSKEQNRFNDLMKTMGEFTIIAPASGMVIYDREWNGRKKTVGSQISAWDPTVATLPDLTKMESITYINEVDIQKIKKDQFVRIKLDANSGKSLTGIVTQVANIGEQRPNSESKVFETKVQVTEVDTTLRPSMTTSNEMLVSQIENSLFIPIEAIRNENNLPFVYKKQGRKFIKQEVKVGAMNENEAIIEKGITDNDEILMNEPEDAQKLEFVKLSQ